MNDYGDNDLRNALWQASGEECDTNDALRRVQSRVRRIRRRRMDAIGVGLLAAIVVTLSIAARSDSRGSPEHPAPAATIVTEPTVVSIAPLPAIAPSTPIAPSAAPADPAMAATPGAAAAAAVQPVDAAPPDALSEVVVADGTQAAEPSVPDAAAAGSAPPAPASASAPVSGSERQRRTTTTTSTTDDQADRGGGDRTGLGWRRQSRHRRRDARPLSPDYITDPAHSALVSQSVAFRWRRVGCG